MAGSTSRTRSSFVRTATQGAPCVFDVTGATAGVGRCKKGDAVLRFTAESASPVRGVVFEAKHDATYTVQRAIDELDAARKNRDAAAGVFVMARSHASDVFPAIRSLWKQRLVTWDDQDPATDAYLHAAVLLGMALVMRSRTTGDAGDIAALRDVESRIEGELSGSRRWRSTATRSGRTWMASATRSVRRRRHSTSCSEGPEHLAGAERRVQRRGRGEGRPIALPGALRGRGARASRGAEAA